MYLHTLRNVLNISTSFLSKKNLTNKYLLSPSFVVELQKVIPFTYNFSITYNLSVNFSNNANTTSCNYPTERKNLIDEKAQEKINELLKDPEFDKKKQIIELEVSHLRYKGDEVPSVLRPRDWLEIFDLTNFNRRKKFLRYLFINEKHREKSQDIKMKKSIKLEEVRNIRKSLDPNLDDEEYGVIRNTMFRRITNTTMNKLWVWNCLKSCMFGNQIVFDCSFDKYMNVQEIRSCARQIMQAYSDNRIHNYPFHIWLCNTDFSSSLIEYLSRYIPNLLEDDFPITITPKSYLEVFPKSQLIYLTSDSPNMLENYNPDLIYIIGAYVDKGCKQPISLAKAKEQRLNTAKLPLDKYMRFGDGSGKTLTVNQVCSILLDLQNSDWKTALKHVPRRKLYESRVAMMESKIKRDLQMHNMRLNQFKKFESNVKKVKLSESAVSFRPIHKKQEPY